MVRLARLLSNLFLLAFIFSSCYSRKSVTVDALDSSLTYRGDILFRNGVAFTGKTFSLYAGSVDTAEIRNYYEGKEHGRWKKFYADGKIQESREFDGGRKTGFYVAWWQNGNRKLEYHFDDDEYEGICREWNEHGVLIREMNYAKGHESGTQKMFYDNGKVRANYVIVNGRRYGLLGTKNCVNVSDSVFKN